MMRTVTPARRLTGELRVPGESEAAAEALVLAKPSVCFERIQQLQDGAIHR